jgi:phage gpG-like protein
MVIARSTASGMTAMQPMTPAAAQRPGWRSRRSSTIRVRSGKIRKHPGNASLNASIAAPGERANAAWF